jgi:hypothetical protein
MYKEKKDIFYQKLCSLGKCAILLSLAFISCYKQMFHQHQCHCASDPSCSSFLFARGHFKHMIVFWSLNP